MVKTMSKNDPITCFNEQECNYKKCGMYEQTLDICAIEHLKHVVIQQAGEQVNPMRNQPAPRQASPREKIAGANKKPFTRAVDVVSGMKGVKLHGKLLDDPVEAEVNTRKGPMNIVKFRLDDGTAEIRLTFWNPGKVPILKAGDEITVDGLLGTEPYDGVPQANGGDYVKVIFEKV